MGGFGVPRSLVFRHPSWNSFLLIFLMQNEGFGSPRRRPHFSKNRSQDDALKMSKKLSLQPSCESLSA